MPFIFTLLIFSQIEIPKPKESSEGEKWGLYSFQDFIVENWFFIAAVVLIILIVLFYARHKKKERKALREKRNAENKKNSPND